MDQNGQSVMPLVSGTNAMMVDDYTPDNTDPTLDQFDLSLHDETLTLRFSETVDMAYFNVTQITITSDAVQDLEGSGDDVATTKFALTANSVSHSNDYWTIIVNLGTLDLNEIKKLTGLATSTADSFLTVTALMVKDTFENALAPVVDTDALQVSTYVRDEVDPKFVGFCLNMDGEIGLLELTFDETVNILIERLHISMKCVSFSTYF